MQKLAETLHATERGVIRTKKNTRTLHNVLLASKLTKIRRENREKSWKAKRSQPVSYQQATMGVFVNKSKFQTLNELTSDGVLYGSYRSSNGSRCRVSERAWCKVSRYSVL